MGISTRIDAYVRRLCAQGQAERAFAVIAELQKLTLRAADSDDLTLADKIGFADFVAYLPIEVLLVCSQALEERTPESYQRRLAKISWTNTDSIYRHGFPLDSLDTLEWLQARIAPERWTEGTIVTPVWYSLTLLLLRDARLISALTPNLLSIENRFLKFAADLQKAKQPLIAAAVISRGLEYVSKLEFHLQKFVACSKSITANQKIRGLDWPKIDTTSWEKTLTTQSQLLRDRAAQLIPSLVVQNTDDKVPDYRGQFIQVVGNDLLSKAIAGDSNGFAKLFSAYFVGCFTVSQDLRPSDLTSAPHLLEERFHVASAPLIDLMDLSGYARLLSEFHNKPELWQPVQTAWDLYLEKTSSGLQFLSAVVSLENIRFMLPHRGALRTEWEIKINNLLGKLPLRILARGRFSELEAFTHESALVRMFANSGQMDGVEVFVGDFLARKTGSDGLTWGYKRPRDFQRRLEQEREEFDTDAQTEETE
jgi:hypothetical protein